VRGRRLGSRRRRESDVADTHDGRTGFGNRLRRLREDSDLSGRQLAERLNWPPSKVSRLENGRQTATADDVRAWTGVLNVPAPVRNQLIEDLRSLRVEYATWRRQLRSGTAARQRVSGILESDAKSVRNLQTALIPGLLQIADYAGAVFRGLAVIHGQRDIEASVHERIRRQELLYQPERSFRFLVTEAALRARIGTPGTHRMQLDRLQGLMGLDTTRLAILPWSAECLTPPDHNFVIYDDRLVLVETLNAEVAIREADDIALYARLFESYWDAALHGEQASALITRIALELPSR
jgi:transcriptional regulator with XRE-family HTH domain